MARDSSLAALTDFDKATLKKSETCEKNPLPPAEAIAQEMEHLKFKVIHPPTPSLRLISPLYLTAISDTWPFQQCHFVTLPRVSFLFALSVGVVGSFKGLCHEKNIFLKV
jgi:hypothetical protein